MELVTKELIRSWYIPRQPEGYKGDYGHTLIMAGSAGFTGAAFIAAHTAVRSGSGLVTLAVYPEIFEILSIKAVEYMMVTTIEKERLTSLLDGCTCTAFGPGMGNTSRTRRHLLDTLAFCSCPIVLDADGLNVLEGNIDVLLKKRGALILTPHFGEFSRLIGLPIKEIKKNKEKITKAFAKKYGVILVLKDHRTLITDGEKIYINTTGNSAMASGGMGDCLTGLIASLVSQGYPPFKAAVMGVFIHGYCGDELSKDLFSVNASQMMEKLPYIMKEIYDTIKK